jgi:hypothetical protein
VADVLAATRALMDQEGKRMREIEAGVRFKPEIDEALRKKGVID